jgi:hypothetical protein
LEYLDVLDRIIGHLDANPKRYEFVNISLGPNMAVDDNDVTQWTAMLDERFAHGRLLATAAAGNDGELDPAAGLNRIQPPADGVNVLSVGACQPDGKRTVYSCVGPGRSPGLVKPDGVIEGGCDTDHFYVLALDKRGSRAVGQQGTSFAAPYALRTGTGVRSHLGAPLNPLAIRALMVHRAQPGNHPRAEVGWGRFETEVSRLLTCQDDEALVIYQGKLPVGQHLRVPVPVRGVPLRGMVTISATIMIAPEVDPAHPSSYTRSGLEVAFRPNNNRRRVNPDGSMSQQPVTKPFFSATNMYGAAEWQYRDDGVKWEPCLRNEHRFRADTLELPMFDVYYHHRAGAGETAAVEEIPYAMVVGVRAPQVNDLYSRVVRAYPGILVPLKPQVRIQIKP